MKNAIYLYLTRTKTNHVLKFMEFVVVAREAA